METQAKKYDVTIIGAGVTGLLLTKELAQLGISVMLVEKNEVIAKGPSTRNEGWIHCGSYHAFGIDDESTAIRVAKNCKYGHQRINNEYPECIEEPNTVSVALIKEKDNVDKAIKRWNMAGVEFKKLTKKELCSILNDVNIPTGAVGFEVKERAINTRILYKRILEQINLISHRNPDKVCIKTSVNNIRFFQDKQTVTLQINNSRFQTVESKFFVYTAGAGIKNIFSAEHPEIECPIRIFQSHLLVTERMSRNNVFFIEQGEITAMNHNDKTVIGSTKDNDEIRFIKDEEKSSKKRSLHLSSRTASLFKKTLGDYKVYSCSKVDVGENRGYQSLEPKIYEDEKLPNHIICCPGKMTEAPILVNKLVQKLFSKIDNSIVAKRPCDKFKLNK